MLQVRRDSDLGQEPLDADDRAELRVEHLERDVAIVPEIAREVDGGHSARADLALDDIAIGEPAKELFSQLWHSANVTPTCRAC